MINKSIKFSKRIENTKIEVSVWLINGELSVLKIDADGSGRNPIVIDDAKKLDDFCYAITCISDLIRDEILNWKKAE